MMLNARKKLAAFTRMSADFKTRQVRFYICFQITFIRVHPRLV